MNAASQRRTIVDHEVRGGAATPITRNNSEVSRIGKRFTDQQLTDVFQRMSDDENLVYLTARVQNYAQLAEARMGALKQALDTGDCDTMAVIAHALTDATARIGAIELMKLSISLQMLARRRKIEAAASTFDKLEKSYFAFKQNLISEW